MARCDFRVEALCGTIVDSGVERDPADLLTDLGLTFEAGDEGGWTVGASGVHAVTPPHLRATIGGVPLTIHRRPSRRFELASRDEAQELHSLFEAVLDRFRPDVLMTYGGDPLTLKLLARARKQGVAIVFALHNFSYSRPQMFSLTDAVLVASRFAADYYRAALGLDCTVLPYLVDHGRVRAEGREPQYVTFVNPSGEKGVFPFTRIADELGRRRPDIPLLVIESRGTERTLVSCGIDLRSHGNVFLMAQTHDPREFWGVTRICLLPSLWWENQPLAAVEAMINGIPVVGSDRGGIPETLGGAGIILPLPDRLTPATRTLPTAEEVAPWVEAIVRLWDDTGLYAEHRRRVLVEAERWAPEVVEPQYVRFFNELRHGAPPVGCGKEIRTAWAVLLPFTREIPGECDRALRMLEGEGVRVFRTPAEQGLDVARNSLISDALRAGSRALLLIDPEIGFDPYDALRVLARTEPVIVGAGFGQQAPGMYPIDRIGTEFLRLRAEILERMIGSHGLFPLRDRAGRSFWPFFQESIILSGNGDPLYLESETTFSHRLRQLGVTPIADTSLQLQRRPR